MMHIFHQRSVRARPLLLAFSALALFAAGCSEPFTAYRLSGEQYHVAQGRKILVMPFMDTRTFIDKDDEHRVDLGAHARTIFVGAMRSYNADSIADILTPAMSQPVKSLTNAEVAEFGRAYGADYVVAGQVFSYTGTRAVSIPARAGMFIRVISARDGSLLFVGDHYQAAAIPGQSGGRELQARYVSNRLIEGFLAKARSTAVAAGSIAATGALAMIAPVPVAARRTPAGKEGGNTASGDDPRPGPKPVVFPDFDGGNMFDSGEWGEQIVPEVPPLLDFQDDFYTLPLPALVEPPPLAADNGDAPDQPDSAPSVTETPPAGDPVASALSDIQERREDSATGPEIYPAEPPQIETVEVVGTAGHSGAAETETAARPAEEAVAPAAGEVEAVSVAEEVVATHPEPAEPTAPVVETKVVGQVLGETEETGQFYREPAHYVESYVDTAAAAVIDELPELDIRKINPNMISVDAPPPAPVAAGLTGDELGADLFSDLEEALLRVEQDAPSDRDRPGANNIVAGSAAQKDGTAAAWSARESAARLRPTAKRRPAAAVDNGPVVSMPLAVEQPSTVKTVNRELAENPDSAPAGRAAVATPNRGGPGGIRLLILPYHDRPNSNNLIPNTGGGEVVTTLYGTQLALDQGITLLWDGSGQATHDRLLTRDEAIEMGRLAGADYVMRGQVVEFRRAQSVPSFYSAMISTAVLAAQIFFAEMSGVDVATEVYRVSDGMCVMSRRDRSQQKYVVQAEKTVRRMAAGMADSVGYVLRQPAPQPMDPLIDELSPTALATAR